jgi:cyclase
MTALPPRVIPCLLLDGEAFVKTVRYEEPRYLGDPVNIIDLFNRFEVDEICLLDIAATRDGREPDYDLIRALADECWVPLAYGGGIRSIDAVRQVLAAGIEKVVIGAAAWEHPALVTQAAERFGAQAVVVSIDVRRDPEQASVWIRNATMPTHVDPTSYAVEMVRLGAGELLLNAVDRDGTMTGYDLDLIRAVSGAVQVPVIACGGAATRDDLVEPIRAGAAAVAAGSLFVFQGPSRAVLVNFPERRQVEALFGAVEVG